MKIKNSFALGCSLVMALGLAGSPVSAAGPAWQDQAKQSGSSKKSSSGQKKSNRKELSEEQGGARGFQLPGDESAGAKPSAGPQSNGSKPGKKPASKTATKPSPNKQP